MPTQYNTLIFSPHIDDEVLGCFSFLGPDCFVLHFGAEDRPYVSRIERIQELERAATMLNFQWNVLDNPVNHYRMQDLIPAMELAINQIKPNRVLIPEPSYNQDHRAVYDAGIVATRPHDTNWFVQNVLIFEQPDSLVWLHSKSNEPSYFREIQIEQKLTAYALYSSQVRGHRSPETLQAIASLRGAQICKPYAEAFRVKRLVDFR
ncbi:PIG-L family deacetylase [Methylomonas sp. EFPC1]|uniref:PIG-L deacetylase family protein n=1 Tax=Methylomonas sp. EFPC1 TaxID=2812647 RepID=UPI001967F600|nr:PIG-L family deacetylase [Methylomonas sp. EFPC1]QSB01846.1 PIG-L family deacetylase [Methylomonas sp. EFPC1]